MGTSLLGSYFFPPLQLLFFSIPPPDFQYFCVVNAHTTKKSPPFCFSVTLPSAGCMIKCCVIRESGSGWRARIFFFFLSHLLIPFRYRYAWRGRNIEGIKCHFTSSCPVPLCTLFIEWFGLPQNC